MLPLLAVGIVQRLRELWRLSVGRVSFRLLVRGSALCTSVDKHFAFLFILDFGWFHYHQPRHRFPFAAMQAQRRVAKEAQPTGQLLCLRAALCFPTIICIYFS